LSCFSKWEQLNRKLESLPAAFNAAKENFF
jgi:hypothetical protein